MLRLHEGDEAWPLRLGHEWVGRVRELAADVDPVWAGRRVTGDCMIGCGKCSLCKRGRHYVCAQRVEVGVRKRDGAMAERIVLPVTDLLVVPETLSAAAGAMIEPGGNAWRAVAAADASPASRILIWGAGTIGLLATQFARAAGAEVHVVARRQASRQAAFEAGAAAAFDATDLPSFPSQEVGYTAVIEASGDPAAPTACARAVEPGGRLVLIGVASGPSLLDTRRLVVKDITTIGILGGSLGLAPTVAAYASGQVNPGTLVDRVVGLGQVTEVLAGWAGQAKGKAPKIQVDPSV
jgi:threonine dehydrogenase-like Zn-dependent dehydrogenase